MKLLLSLFCLLFAGICFAQDPVPASFTSRDGTVYTGVTDVKVTPNGVTVTHEAGISRVGFYNLTDEQIAQYGLSQETAAAHTASEKEKARQAQAIQQKVTLEREQARNIEELKKKYAFQASGSVFQVVPGAGILFKGYKEEAYFATEQREDGSLRNQTSDPRAYKSMVSVKVQRTRRIPIGDNDMNLAFLECTTDELSDNDGVNGTLYPCGTHSYTTTIGALKTIPKFTTSLETFLRYRQSKK